MPEEMKPWELFAAQKATQESVKPWELYSPKPREATFTPSREAWGRLRLGFAGDPLAILSDDYSRAKIALEVDRMDDPETFKKRYALAAYYCQMNKNDFPFVLSNLDAFMKKYNNGKQTTIEAAYADIASMLNPSQINDGGWKEATKAGGSGVLKTLSNLGLMLLEGNAMTVAGGPKELRSIHRGADIARDATVGYWSDVQQENYARVLPENWFSSSRSAADWGRNAAYAVLMEAPQMAIQAGLTMANPALGIGYMAVSSGNDKLYDLEQNNPEMSDGAQLVNAVATGIINGTLERVTVGIIKAKGLRLDPESLKAGFKEGVKYYLKSAGKESLEEGTEQLLENAADIITGVHGDYHQKTPMELKELLLSGVPESMVIGGLYGDLFAVLGHRSLRKTDQIRLQAVKTLEAERSRLLAVENPTDEDITQLHDVEAVLDAGNINQLAAVAINFANREVERRELISDQEAELTDEERIQQAADDAARNYALRQQLPHNPQDVYDAVTEYSKHIRNTVFHVVDSPTQYPAKVIEEAKRRGYDAGVVPRGFWYDNEVWLDSSRVRPSEVPAELTHEVVSHKGLRAIIPEKQWDAFLDNVYREHFQDETFKEVAGIYFADKMATLTDEETGEPYWDISLDRVEDQRYAAEEFMSHVAVKSDVKPSWWKELLQKVRMTLARLPYMREVRMTDQQIGVLLSRSARAMRRTRMEERFGWRKSTIAKGEANGNSDGDVRFAAALRREGAPNHAREKGKLVDSNVPCALGFMEWAGLDGVGLYADAEMLVGKHYEYFESQVHAMAATAFVLAAPGKAHDVSGNLAFVRKDDQSGQYFRIEIRKRVSGKRNQIRSTHKLNERQYQEAKIGDFPVLQPSLAGADGVQAARSYSDFVEYYTAKYPDVKFSLAPSIESEALLTHVMPANIDWSDTSVAKEYLLEHFQGREVEIKADGRLAFFGRKGLEATLKRRGDHRKSFTELDRIVENSYPVGYEFVDERHVGKHPDLRGQFIYAALLDIESELYIATIKLDDSTIEHRAKFKDIAIKKMGDALSMGHSDKAELRNPSEASPSISIQHVIDFVKNDFKNTHLFTEDIPTQLIRPDDIRFSLSEYSEANRDDIIAMLRPIAGTVLDKAETEYAQYLAGKGVNIPVEDARYFAVLAMKQNASEERKRADQRRDDWLYQNVPEWQRVVDFVSSSDFTIRPSARFSGEKFSGTFIETGKKSKGGYPSDEIAQGIARRYGGDPIEIEQQMIDFFRDMKKPDLHRMYSDWKKENLFSNKEQEKRMLEEWMISEDAANEQAAVDLIGSGQEITEEWIHDNRNVYNKLYAALFPGKNIPYSIGKKDLEAINAALLQRQGDAASYARAYKVAREMAYTEFAEKLRDFKEKLMQRNREAIDLQYKAKDFAYKHIDKGFREKFISGIIRLAKYSTSPSKRFPDGHRQAEFDKLCKEMVDFSAKVRRDKAISEIRSLLDRNRAKRTAKNVPFSPMGERQPALDRIAQVVRMSPETVSGIYNYILAEKAAAQEAAENLSGDDVDAMNNARARLEKADREVFYLDNFGTLSLKKPDVAVNSLKLLRKFIKEGRDEFVVKVRDDAARFEEIRGGIIKEMSGGSMDIPSENELDRRVSNASDYFSMSESITVLLDRFSRTDNLVDLDSSRSGQLISMIDRATQTEQTGLNRMQTFLDTALKEACGVKDLIEKGKFLNGAFEEQKDVIRITEYGTLFGKKDEEAIRWGRRPQRRAEMHTEHCRKMLDELASGSAPQTITGFLPFGSLEVAQKMRAELKEAEIDTGRYFSVCVCKDGSFRIYTENDANETVAFDVPQKELPTANQIMGKDEFAVFPISDITITGARERLIEHDSGVSDVTRGNLGDDVDNAAWDAFVASEHGSSRIDLITESPKAVTREISLSLSPGAAMQLIMTWEQKHYQPNMTWNGWDSDKIQKLRDWLKDLNPGYLKLADVLRDYIAEGQPELDRAVFDRYGVHLPENKNFFYANFFGTNADKIMDAGYGNMTGGMTVSANFLTARRFHLLPPDTKGNAIQLFMTKQLEQNHFIAWTQPIRELRAAYGSKNVQNVLIKEFGQTAWNNLKAKIEALAAGGAFPDKAAKYFSGLFKSWIPANITMNIGSITKQVAGGTSYALYAPAGGMLRHIGEANPANPAYRRWLNIACNDPYIKNRLAGGLDPNLTHMLNYTRNSGKVSPVSERALQLMTLPTLKADEFSALTWGYAAYRCFEEMGGKRKMSAEEIHDFAWRMWRRATDQTQQSGYLKDANHFTMNQGLWRYLTCYMTNPMQTAALELSAWQKYSKDKTKGNREVLIRRMVINHFVVPTFMNLIGSAMRHGANLGDYAEDWDDYLAGWILGSFDSLWLFGKGASMIFSGLAGDYYGTDMTAVPLLGDLAKDGALLRKALRAPEEVEVLDAMKATGDLLMSGGPVQSRTLGLALYAIARQGKRIAKWFTE